MKAIVIFSAIFVAAASASYLFTTALVWVIFWCLNHVGFHIVGNIWIWGLVVWLILWLGKGLNSK